MIYRFLMINHPLIDTHVKTVHITIKYWSLTLRLTREPSREVIKLDGNEIFHRSTSNI